MVKARKLYTECTGPQSILFGNERYQQFIKGVPQFLRLFGRNIDVLVDDEWDDKDKKLISDYDHLNSE